ncbi:MAG: hypothetical protein MI922_09270 [Bacteroidales bacterium]|nr:hypothetical protein [Bacteroidales bacterium]
MKIRNYLIAGVVAGLFFTGCDKNDDVIDADKVKYEDPYEAEFSQKTIEENKDNLETTGVNLVTELEDLEDEQAVKVMVNMASLPEPSTSESVAVGMAPMKLLASLANRKVSPHDAFETLKSTAEADPTITDEWNDIVGKYTYNFVTDDWDKTELSDAVVFEFPGLETDETNTASLTIDNFAAKTIVDDYDIGTTELPTSIKASLKYDGTEIASYTYAGTFQNDGMPLTIKSTLKIAAFSLSVDFSNTPYTAIGATGSFKHDDKIIIEKHVDFKGDWSQQNIEDNTVPMKEFGWVDYKGDTIYDEWDEVYVENILQQANAYVQVLDVKVVGKVELKKLGTDFRAFMEKYDDYEDDEITEEIAEELVAIFNDNATLIVVYAETNQKIATAEAYAFKDDYNEWDANIRFEFADGTKMDPETFVEEGFGDLIDEMNDFINELNAAYDLDMEPIE